MNKRYLYIINHLKKADFYLKKAEVSTSVEEIKKYLIISQFHENLCSYQFKNPLFINLNYKEIFYLSSLMVSAQIKSLLNNTNSNIDINVLKKLININDSFKFSWKNLLEKYLEIQKEE